MPARAMALIRALASASGPAGLAASSSTQARASLRSDVPGTTRWTRPIAWASAAEYRSEEHTSELQSLTISYAVFCLKKKKRENPTDEAVQTSSRDPQA